MQNPPNEQSRTRIATVRRVLGDILNAGHCRYECMDLFAHDGLHLFTTRIRGATNST